MSEDPSVILKTDSVSAETVYEVFSFTENVAVDSEQHIAAQACAPEGQQATAAAFVDLKHVRSLFLPWPCSSDGLHRACYVDP